ncbi:transglycosylase SLT domain-containing protein [Kitasatospora sp. NPDC089509]|uniref:transglycosylase SLT domain-containing protein n=1 Tax=Kitasatospora sp. NPDC089509 TaxID=3364079 RepID=UPI0037FF1B56
MSSSTTRRTAALVSAVAVSTAVLAGCGTESADKHPNAASSTTLTAATATPSDPASASPSAGTTPTPTGSASASPSASHSPSASASKSAKASPTAQAGNAKSGGNAAGAPATQPPVEKPAIPAPVPTAKPGAVALPAPPAPPVPHVPPLQSGCQPSKPQPDEPKTAVGAALTAAAGQSRVLTLSSGGTDKLPPLPVNLVKAIAWQESGWQSGILACDGGIGTMQIMTNTVSWMNGKYGTNSDPKTLTGNVQLGTQLLDWLVAYYGDSSFDGKYDLSPDPATGKTPLLDLVISAYNAGAGNVHYTTVTDPTSGQIVGSLDIPNPKYVANVKALMAGQPWNAAG